MLEQIQINRRMFVENVRIEAWPAASHRHNNAACAPVTLRKSPRFRLDRNDQAKAMASLAANTMGSERCPWRGCWPCWRVRPV